MTPCINCNQPTNGSIGAAGIAWPMICQPCKDKADNDLRLTVNLVQKSISNLFADIAGISPERRRELDADYLRAQKIRDEYDPTPDGDDEAISYNGDE